jgi:hypothetical protein
MHVAYVGQQDIAVLRAEILQLDYRRGIVVAFLRSKPIGREACSQGLVTVESPSLVFQTLVGSGKEKGQPLRSALKTVIDDP